MLRRLLHLSLFGACSASHLSLEDALGDFKDPESVAAWKKGIETSVRTFEQVEHTAHKLNMTVEALAERVAGRAKAITETLTTYAQVVRTAKEINMSAQELEEAFENRARSIDETVQNYREVDQLAKSLNMSVDQLGDQIRIRAQAIQDLLRNREATLAAAKKLNIMVHPWEVQAAELPFPDILSAPPPAPQPLETLAGVHDAENKQRDDAEGSRNKQSQNADQFRPQREQQSAPQEHPLLFVGIYTAPGEKAAQRRAEIRETYWNDELLKPGGKVKAKFVIGWADVNTAEEKELEKEIASRPSEFLRLNVNEKYENLTSKTMALLRWFAQTMPAKWLLKLDDDTFPHFDVISARLEREKSRYVEMGMMFDCAPVLKETKWAEDPTLWNQTHFPKYMQGSGYFLSADLIKVLAEERYEYNKRLLLHNEDAAIGVWMEMGKVANPSWQVELKPIASTLTGCQPGDLLSMNNQPGYMKCYWGRKMRGEKDVCCYGPLNNLRQSFLQQQVTVHQRSRLGCYPSSVTSVLGER